MWQIINVEPADGECSICRSHECGVVDGKHQWIMSDYLGQETDRVYIGYKCVQLFAANLGITKEVVEKEVHVAPSDEQIMKVLRECFTIPESGKWSVDIDPIPNDTIVPRFTAASAISILEHHEEPKNKASHRGKGTATK